MTKKLDAGNIIARQSYEILESDNSITLHEKFSKIGANLIVDLIKNGSTMEEVQNDEAVVYAKKIEKSELELKDFSNSTIEILNKIRAFASYGYCFKMYEGKRFKFILAQISKTRLTKIDIECTDGFVSPLIIRPEGKGNLGVKDYQF
jgi:methionyl-tRNA formyltransferase